MFLITTALEETWQQGNSPALVIGEWCLRYSRKEIWSKMNLTILPYHWDNRNKMHLDFLYLQELHEKILAELTIELNYIHKTDHDIRYWRILIGPWLGYFTQMLLDRWTSLTQAISNHNISHTIILKYPEDLFIPKSMSDFDSMFTTDEWNQYIYGLLIKQFSEIKYTEKTAISPAKKTNLNSPYTRVKKGISKILKNIFSIFVRKNDCFFMATYLPFWKECLVSLKLGQLPQRWILEALPETHFDKNQRMWKFNTQGLNEFESCLRSLIPQQIPLDYIEGYSALIKKTQSLSWPSTPALIWTSNAYNSDDVFKAWAAEKTKRGTPLLVGQHGGHYGMGLDSFTENHQIAICNNFLSWGWIEKNQSKIIPLGQLKFKKPLGIDHAKESHALLVTFTMPKQSYHMYSATVSRQWLDYLQDQFEFVSHLPVNIQDLLKVRLYYQDYGWDQLLRWRERFPHLNYDQGQTKMDDLISQSKLYISTYNATTYLESFTMNIPTVIYWRPEHWELRESALPFFEELKRVGIFHESPASAAKHVTAIWNDIQAWWTSEDVVNVLERFKATYCHIPKNMTDDLVDIIEKIKSEQK